MKQNKTPSTEEQNRKKKCDNCKEILTEEEFKFSKKWGSLFLCSKCRKEHNKNKKRGISPRGLSI